jgi:hypothetical protein
MIENGQNFRATLQALNLDPAQRAATSQNAVQMTGAIMEAYGMRPDGTLNTSRIPANPVTGLVYGRIQSGKTRAMIASTAMAFDNGFRISVVMTSNINDLVSQTHIDFSRGLPGIMTFTKDSDFDREVVNTRLHLERGDGRLLLICSKGGTSLRNISQFLTDIDARRYPTILFDDEGDQASLDTNTRRRTTGRAVPPSTINNRIQTSLRPAVPRHVYVSVTGTPQAVLLQSAGSSHRPSFIVMLPPGNGYVGGDRFFSSDEPENNPNLIALVASNEQRQLLDATQPIPTGLRESILFFLVSAAAAIQNLGIPEQGYSYLCHPSLRNNEQSIAEGRINTFLTDIYAAILAHNPGGPIIQELRNAHARLSSSLGNGTPNFDQCLVTLRQHLPGRRILVINTSVRRQGIQYGRGLNFLIGGNTLGRGIAIRHLLVTYYVRDARVSQIDTMHQHARMYGYRTQTLPYTRLYVPRHLYYRFRDIHHSDEDLRTFIEQRAPALPETFPVEFAFDRRANQPIARLRATRLGVLDARRIETLRPGMQIFPNYITLPQNQQVYERVLNVLRNRFGVPNGSPDAIARAGRQGVEVPASVAVQIVSQIRSDSRNTWRDATIAAVITKIAANFNNRVLLRFRTADRRIREDGLISTGTLSGAEFAASRRNQIPSLWIMAAQATADSDYGQGQRFIYPTFVIPTAFPSLFLFNGG